MFKYLIEISWFIGRFKAGIFEKYLFFLYQSWVFVTEDAFNIEFYIFYNKFRHYPVAKQFIEGKIILNMGKIVLFFTKRIFTTGHTSSQRLESLNSFFKGLKQ